MAWSVLHSLALPCRFGLGAKTTHAPIWEQQTYSAKYSNSRSLLSILKAPDRKDRAMEQSASPLMKWYTIKKQGDKG